MGCVRRCTADGNRVQRTRFEPRQPPQQIRPTSTEISRQWRLQSCGGTKRADRISTYNLTWTRYLSPLSPRWRKVSIVHRRSSTFPPPFSSTVSPVPHSTPLHLSQEFDRLSAKRNIRLDYLRPSPRTCRSKRMRKKCYPWSTVWITDASVSTFAGKIGESLFRREFNVSTRWPLFRSVTAMLERLVVEIVALYLQS